MRLTGISQSLAWGAHPAGRPGVGQATPVVHFGSQRGPGYRLIAPSHEAEKPSPIPFSVFRESAPAAPVGQRSPAPQEPDYTVVIVGGGLAGMTAATLAQRHGLKTLLLESTHRLGGNSGTGYRNLVSDPAPVPVKASAAMGTGTPAFAQQDVLQFPHAGGTLKAAPVTRQRVQTDAPAGQMIYPTGSSVLCVVNDEQREFFKSLGVDVNDPRFELRPSQVWLNNKWVSLEPKKPLKDPVARQFVDDYNAFIAQMMKHLRPRKDYPVFPLRRMAPQVFRYDKMTMARYLQLHSPNPHVTALLTTTLRSNVAQRPESLAALAGMLDISSDVGQRVLLPGGNHFLVRRMKSLLQAAPDPQVQMETMKTVEAIRENPHGVTVTYMDEHHEPRQVTARYALVGIPSHKIPDLMPLPVKKAQLLRNIDRGAYALINFYLPDSPVASNTYFNFIGARWTTDAVLVNARGNPKLKPGSKVPSVLTVYVGIPPSEIHDVKSNAWLVRQVMDEVSGAWPWIKDKVQATRVTYYPEAMSAPAPGQMSRIRTFDRVLSRDKRHPKTWTIHSDLSGVFTAHGAFDEAKHGIEAIIREEDRRKSHLGSRLAVRA